MKRFITCTTCLLSLFIFPGCSPEKFMLTETNKDPFPAATENIVIIGVGSNQVRVFLEPVADKLVKAFVAKKTHASYFYAGKNKEEVSKFVSGINPGKNDVVFIIVPRRDHSLVPYTFVDNTYYPTVNGGITGRSVVQGAWLNDEFFLNMYQSDQQKEPFWSSTMMIKCEVGTNRTINKVAGMIMSALQKNNYLAVKAGASKP